MNDATKELLELRRRIAANDQRMITQLVGLVRLLAADIEALCAITRPESEPERIIVRGCRQRAEKMFENLGDDRVAH
jgi:hypothetical protein